MKLKELKLLVDQGEGENIEFKRKARHPEKIVREIVAFANSKGGYLIVGVDDNGQIPGLKHYDEDKYVLDRVIASHCRPAIRYRFNLVKLSDHRAVLVYHILPSRKRPHFALEYEDQKWGQAYIRIEDRTVQASKEMVQILKRQRRRKPVQFTYGTNEKTLFQILEENGKITIQELIDHTKMQPKEASNMLIDMVVADILQVQAREKEDFYMLKPT
jgi:predicted HTH transcriptional regulator